MGGHLIRPCIEGSNATTTTTGGIMKARITISLTKEEAIYLTKILYDNNYGYESRTCVRSDSENESLLDQLVDLLEVKPWDL
jgi:hypothetical protein